jgi:hypothetical protein
MHFVLTLLGASSVRANPTLLEIRSRDALTLMNAQLLRNLVETTLFVRMPRQDSTVFARKVTVQNQTPRLHVNKLT